MVPPAEIVSIDPDAPLKNRRWQHLVAAGCVALLVLLCSVVWPTSEVSFTPLGAGAYTGEVVFSDGLATRTELHFYLEVAGDDSIALFLAPLEEGGEAREILIADGRRSSVWPALLLQGPDGEVRLSGGRLTEGIYRGEAINEERSSEGVWSLKPLKVSATVPVSPHDLKLWLSLLDEGRKADEAIQRAEQLAPQQREEIEKLTAFISERGELKARADQKLRLISDELQKSRDLLAEKRKEARRLEQKIDLALKVLPMGRLVLLSRETLEREGRWITSVQRTGGAEGSPELAAAVARAEEVQTLQKRIRELRIELSRPQLEGQSPSPSEDPEL